MPLLHYRVLYRCDASWRKNKSHTNINTLFCTRIQFFFVFFSLPKFCKWQYLTIYWSQDLGVEPVHQCSTFYFTNYNCMHIKVHQKINLKWLKHDHNDVLQFCKELSHGFIPISFHSFNHECTLWMGCIHKLPCWLVVLQSIGY